MTVEVTLNNALTPTELLLFSIAKNIRYTDQEFAQLLGISQKTVVKAFHSLAEKGYLPNEKGKAKPKTKRIFQRWMAFELRKAGFPIIGTEPNSANPKYNIYIFQETPALLACLTQLTTQHIKENVNDNTKSKDSSNTTKSAN